MLPIADTHVHLLAARDDGPRSPDEAIAMARMLVAEGARYATALAHQNIQYPDNSARALTAAAVELATELAAAGIPLLVVPTGEVMLSDSTADQFASGHLQTIGGHGKFLLVEMPHNVFLDIRPLAASLRSSGVRLVIAHAERYPELLHDPEVTAEFIAAGCLIQVTASELADPPTTADEMALKDWALRGVIHVLGSDGHRIDSRQPRLKAGYDRLVKWAGAGTADRIAGIWGAALLQGLPVNPPKPREKPRSWFAKLLGG